MKKLTTPPTIEKICNNILVEVGSIDIGDTQTTLSIILKEFRKLLKTNPILSEETLIYIENIERNKLLHGNITPLNEMQIFFINLMLSVIIQIFQDYENYSKQSL